MRTVSFSEKTVRDLLANDFYSAYTNTKGDPTSGMSFSHSPNDQPGPCGRGAGRQNVQCIFMTRGGEIFHVAGGFLSGEDLAKEISFANRLFGAMEKSTDPQSVVVDQHVQFLTKAGFTSEQIRTGRVGMFSEGMPDFSPKDLGINLPNQASNQFFDQMHNRRTLADHRYCILHPMISKKAFDQQPEELVGAQKSFFGSNAAMNTAIPTINNNLQPMRDFKIDKDFMRNVQFDFDRSGRGRGRR